MPPSEPAELEITLARHGELGSYVVGLRFASAGSDGEVDPLQGRRAPARIDFEQLQALYLLPEEYGRSLSASLFADDALRRGFENIRARVGGDTLRVRLDVDASAAELHALRWELLADPASAVADPARDLDGDGYVPLFAGQRVHLARYLSSRDWREVRTEARGNLRVLVVVAGPTDLGRYSLPHWDVPPIDVAAEVARARQALPDLPLTVLATGETGHRPADQIAGPATLLAGPATLTAMTRELQHCFDIVYLVCHGALIDGEPLLLLEGDAGRAAPTPGDELVQRIAELEQPPRLVVLLSCQSAGDEWAAPATESALAALGPRLAAAGVPAVVAMQGNITMQTAADLIPAFFGSLLADEAGGGRIDRALAVARRVVSDRPDWWMPALFMRLRGGRLWHPAADTANPHPAARPITINTIPPPPPDFVGRAEVLAKLEASIVAGGAMIQGVRGMGGVGKTTLAYALVDRLRPSYPDAQLLIDLKGSTSMPLSAADALGVVLHAFDPVARLPEDEVSLRGLFLTALSRRRVLLLLDDAGDPAQIGPLRPPAGSALLVTTRRSFTVTGLHLEEIDVLPPVEARTLLLEIAPRIGDAADEIARLCGYLPLALRLAGSLLQADDTLSPDAYVERLKDEKQRLAEIDEGQEVTDEQYSVQASLRLSYDALTPDLQMRWRQLAIFPDTFDAAAAGAVWELDAADRTLGLLRRYSLLEWSAETRRFRLHDLARLFADALLMSDECNTCGLRHAQHYLAVLEAAERQYLTGGHGVLTGLALFDRERGNIEAGQSRALDQMGTETLVDRLIVRYPIGAANVLSIRLLACQSITWLDAAVTTARSLSDRRSEGAALANLGIAYASLGESLLAIELYEQALVIEREIGDRHAEGSIVGNLGNIYTFLGAPHRAIEFLERALVIDREIGDRRGEGADLGNLGNAYSVLGEHHRAIELYAQQLNITRGMGDQRGEGNALGNMGLAYAELGEQRRAIELYEQALVIDREIGDRRGEGADLGNLGLVYANLGEPGRAIELYAQQLDITRDIGDRRGERNALGNLGIAYADLGEPCRAVVFYEQALVIDREIGDRRGEGTDLGNSGLAYAALGDPRRAIDFLEQALVIFEQIESPNAAQTRTKLEELRASLDQQPPAADSSSTEA